MAVSTWRNVQGVSPSAGVSSLKSAGDFFNRAISGATKQVDDLQSDLVKRNTDEALNRIRGLSNHEDFESSFDQFSPEALGKYVDQSAIRGAYDAQGKKIEGNFLKEEKRDLAVQQLAADKNRLADQALNRTMGITAENVLSNQVTDTQQFDTNMKAYKTAEDLLNADRPDRIDRASIVDEFGNLDLSNLGQTEKDKVFKSLKTSGAKEIGTFSSTVDNFKKDLKAKGVKGKIYRDVVNTFKSSLNENRFSDAEIAEHNSDKELLQLTYSSELDSANSVFDTALANSPVDTVLTVEQELGAKNNLLSSLQNKYPNEVFGSSVSGNLGGTELLNEISDIMTNGIETSKGFKKPSAAVIEQIILGTSSGNKDDTFFDNYVDKDTLRDDLKKYLNKDPKAQRAMVRNNIKSQRAKFISNRTIQFKKDIKELKNVYKSRAGTPVTGRNAADFATLRNY